jgi:hypothetical protein
MSDFSVTDAAFHGFKVAWQRPRAVALWAALQAVFSPALAVAMVYYCVPLLMKARAIEEAGSAVPPTALTISAQAVPFLFATFAFLLISRAVIMAAINRAVFRPDEDRFGYLRLGADELRQLALLALTTAAILAAFVASLLVSGDLAVIALGAAGAASAPPTAVAVGFSVATAVCVYLSVRLSLASPLTFVTGRVNLIGSWSLTRGRFWPILWTYALATMLILVVYLLGETIALGPAAVVAGGGSKALADLMTPNLTSLQTFLSASRWVQLAVDGALSALAWPLAFSPPAMIYRSLAQLRGAEKRFV